MTQGPTHGLGPSLGPGRGQATSDHSEKLGAASIPCPLFTPTGPGRWALGAVYDAPLRNGLSGGPGDGRIVFCTSQSGYGVILGDFACGEYAQ